jgi:hypothetical protein
MSESLPSVPALPYPVGGARAPVIDALRSTFPTVHHVVIDGGPAKCAAIDQMFVARYQERFGAAGLKKTRRNSIQADWVATDQGLYYVSPDLLDMWLRLWTEAHFLATRQKRTYSELRVEDREGHGFEFQLGTTAVANILTIAHHYGGQR